jgi:hypothetical protein
LIDADVINELFDGLLVLTASKDSSDFYLDKYVVESRAGFHVHFEYYVLLGD